MVKIPLMRRFAYYCLRAPLLLALLVGWGSGGAEAQHSSALPCESTLLHDGARQVQCPLSGAGEKQAFSFRADFSGGHDDTEASMKLLFEGMPVACDTGSKTSLMGEDGDVSLVCLFSVMPSPRPSAALEVSIRWRHAQYTRFELTHR